MLRVELLSVDRDEGLLLVDVVDKVRSDRVDELVELDRRLELVKVEVLEVGV